MIKIKMSNSDIYKVDDSMDYFVEDKLRYTVGNYGQTSTMQYRGIHTINTVECGRVAINIDQICSIEDIEE
ncbi:TPA: hypothetical protein I9071_003083 [Clostridium perfringens]|nr:hypothetical protein [Clostridium perfringens]